jgi:hypothetical protein
MDYQGKTDVAMLTILRVIDQYLTSKQDPQRLASLINKDAFKIIYVYENRFYMHSFELIKIAAHR